MTDARVDDALAILLVSEVMSSERLVRARISRALPKGLPVSHFSVLNLLAGTGGERTPTQLARIFNVTKGAMTNTLRRLEAAGFIHVRRDWRDTRHKRVSISEAGRMARNEALAGIGPVLEQIVDSLGKERARELLPALRELRQAIGGG